MSQQTIQHTGAGSSPASGTAPASRFERLLPLAGAGFAALVAAGYFSIGPFPDETTSPAALSSYYATHHAHVGPGGTLLGYAAVLAALFGVALYGRARRAGAPPLVAVTALVGTAVLTVDLVRAANAYATLGRIGGLASTSTGALQAWHIAGAAPTVSAGAVVLLLAVAYAGLGVRAIPRALAWTALLLAVLLLTPLGFQAWLLFLLWSLVTSLALLARPQR